MINCIDFPIWIQDKKGLIKNSNLAFKNLVQEKNVIENYYWNIIAQKEIILFVEKAIKNFDLSVEEISFDNSFFIVSSYVVSKNELLFFLQDFSQLEEIEKIKRDLLINASHELKTPLTSIRGFLDLLEVEETSKRYLYLIKKNTDRLIHLVRDINLLSSLENNSNLNIVKINIKSMILQIKAIFEQKLKEKNLFFKIIERKKIPLIEIDEFKMEQLFINIIDNAIKYTLKGGIKIYLSYDAKKEKVEIKIKDTGLGIDKSLQKRVFERFFVVSKNRNKEVDNTGLGLSIVKHIVKLHKGNIALESVLHQYSIFTINLPIFQYASRITSSN